MIPPELKERIETLIGAMDLSVNVPAARHLPIIAHENAAIVSADLRSLLTAAQGQEWRDGWVNLPELEGHEPDDDLIREIDRAIHGPWPNARKMATAAYWAVIYGLQGKGRAGSEPLPPAPQVKGEG